MTKDEMFSKYLYDLCNNIPLAQTIMQIHDLIYHTDDKPTIDVDPSYNDAEIEYEARPACTDTIIWMEDQPTTDIDMSIGISDMMEKYRQQVFDPINDIIANRPKSELEQLATEPVEANSMYKRW